MLKRILTALFGLPLVFFLIHKGGLILQVAVFICAMIGLNEIYSAISKNKLRINILGYLLSGAYIFILNNFTFKKFIIISSTFIIIALIFLVFDYKKINIIDCIIMLFGFFYVSFLLSFIILVRKQIYGEFFTWLIFISAWGCDTCAYFFGKIFGRKKLIPGLSPKKTVEGAIGGSLGATLLGFVYAFLISYFYKIKHNNFLLACVIICFVGSVLAQLGDLAASAIKRYNNLKDYGKIFPGHGGFLDRFDSVLFTGPVVYIFLYFMQRINLFG